MKAVALQSNAESAPAMKPHPAAPAPVPLSPEFVQPDRQAVQRKASCACGGGCSQCQGEKAMRSELGHDASQTFDEKSRSAGEPLAQGTRSSMEARFGTRFDDV